MPPDVMNHNLETVPRLYKQARPGASYEHSLKLLKDFKIRRPGVPSKSGLMVGLGETDEEILQVMRDMREHDIDRLTIGQYLAPTRHHLPVERYVTPKRSKCSRKRPTKWASSTQPSVPWCAVRTTRTCRLKKLCATANRKPPEPSFRRAAMPARQVPIPFYTEVYACITAYNPSGPHPAYRVMRGHDHPVFQSFTIILPARRS